MTLKLGCAYKYLERKCRTSGLIPNNSDSIGLEYDLRIGIVIRNSLVMTLGESLRNINVVSCPFKVIKRETEATQGKSVTGSELKFSSLDIQINTISITIALTYGVSPKAKDS